MDIARPESTGDFMMSETGKDALPDRHAQTLEAPIPLYRIIYWHCKARRCIVGAPLAMPVDDPVASAALLVRPSQATGWVEHKGEAPGEASGEALISAPLLGRGSNG